MKYEDASVVASLNYFQVLFLVLADVLHFSYEFSVADVLGSVLITVCLLGS